MIFKQRYGKQIKDWQGRSVSAEGRPPGDLLKYSNIAVQQELADFQQNHPEEYLVLKDMAGAMWEAAKRQFHEQPPELEEV